MSTFLQFIKKDKIFLGIFVITFVSYLRSLVVPLSGDELKYLNIANNIFKGRYYFNDSPSTIIPIVPFFMAFFKISAYPMLGFILHKLFHLFLAILGFRYAYLFLIKNLSNKSISLAIIALTVVNSNAVSGLSNLYPDAILFFSFWGFVYYTTCEYSVSNFKKMLLFALILFLTRYVYAVVFPVVLMSYYYFTSKNMNTKSNIKSIIVFTVILLVPIFFWGKYVYSIIEQFGINSQQEYFSRFNTNNPIWTNIKYGLGIEQSPQVNKMNGVPAFISLFVPMTGIRSYLVSLILIVAFYFGYYKRTLTFGLKIMISCVTLVFLGFIFAGTGFSRYWLPLLPAVYLGYYFLLGKFKISDELFVTITKVICFVYILNDLRLDYMILRKF